VRSAEDLADRFTEVLSEPGVWDRLHQSIRNPVHYIDCAKEHLDLYNRLRESKPRRQKPAVTQTALSQAS
jgi:hypothetical protein